MNSRKMIKFGLSALALGGIAVTGIATQGFTSAAFATSGANAKKAAAEAKEARKAVAKRNAVAAVEHAEAAVANDPTSADYRALLGQAYLLAGRFTSASQALGDALTLAPQDGRIALNLTLAKIAQGDWAGARTTLQAHADTIPASDRGLAFALAGDPVTAIDILGPAAREATATAKTRQNLALSMALAGRWKEATQIAAMDVSPDQLQNRLTEWASFARPTNAYDQVASLLGVHAVEDAGQPVALALAQQPNVALAAAAPVADPVDAYMPGATQATTQVAAEPAVEVAAAPQVETPAEPKAEPQQVAGTGPQVVFGPRAEVVQQVRVAQPAPVRAAPARAAVRTAAVAAPVAAKAKPGNYYVQLGAYENAAVARDAWARHSRRVAALRNETPQGVQFSTGAGNFYRLSVGGFDRSGAAALCQQVRASGSPCFVRVQAGDSVAAWVKGGGRAQVAAR
ncbi:Flp pilus assembly protein TadD [Sphingomonas naasensis]|uniref:SPOR domain-containing protein n=1 Tax=Sphingomonas naasensis TaxID=1344951 RepID=A0A4S1WTQ9_9SPHN|nr:SPOR domain-containing protein [Sphingomonas naasensis]NIJ18905.1 Flp pilus assembly protein TadD [Sphingomonas naasensis]TGX46125.1 SPOR domain-containing protein [Sphingomonas naasensis]